MALAEDQRQEEIILLMKHLLAIELWRGGLTQSEIKTRLELGSEAVTRMLKGVSREVSVRHKPED